MTGIYPYLLHVQKYFISFFFGSDICHTAIHCTINTTFKAVIQYPKLSYFELAIVCFKPTVYNLKCASFSILTWLFAQKSARKALFSLKFEKYKPML